MQRFAAGFNVPPSHQRGAKLPGLQKVGFTASRGPRPAWMRCRLSRNKPRTRPAYPDGGFPVFSVAGARHNRRGRHRFAGGLGDGLRLRSGGGPLVNALAAAGKAGLVRGLLRDNRQRVHAGLGPGLAVTPTFSESR